MHTYVPRYETDNFVPESNLGEKNYHSTDSYVGQLEGLLVQERGPVYAIEPIEKRDIFEEVVASLKPAIAEPSSTQAVAATLPKAPPSFRSH